MKRPPSRKKRPAQEDPEPGFWGWVALATAVLVIASAGFWVGRSTAPETDSWRRRDLEYVVQRLPQCNPKLTMQACSRWPHSSWEPTGTIYVGATGEFCHPRCATWWKQEGP